MLQVAPLMASAVLSVCIYWRMHVVMLGLAECNMLYLTDYPFGAHHLRTVHVLPEGQTNASKVWQ